MSRGVDQMAMTRASLTCILLIAFAACSARQPDAFYTPANVSVGTTVGGSLEQIRAASAPIVASNDAPPQIKRMHFDTLNVCRRTHAACYSDWSGEFVTSTNVASVEVRTNLFSIDVPRRTFGVFAFSVDVLDLPPIFIRDYRLRVIARNSAGVMNEEDVPFHIR